MLLIPSLSHTRCLFCMASLLIQVHRKITGRMPSHGDTTLLLSHSSGVQSCLSWFTKSRTQPTKLPADDNVSKVAKPLRYGGWSHVVSVLMATFNRKRNTGLPGGGMPRVGNGRINPPDSICRRSKSVSLFIKTILNNPFSSPKQVFNVWGKSKNPGSVNQ